MWTLRSYHCAFSLAAGCEQRGIGQAMLNLEQLQPGAFRFAPAGTDFSIGM